MLLNYRVTREQLVAGEGGDGGEGDGVVDEGYETASSTVAGVVA